MKSIWVTGDHRIHRMHSELVGQNILATGGASLVADYLRDETEDKIHDKIQSCPLKSWIQCGAEVLDRDNSKFRFEVSHDWKLTSFPVPNYQSAEAPNRLRLHSQVDSSRTHLAARGIGTKSFLLSNCFDTLNELAQNEKLTVEDSPTSNVDLVIVDDLAAEFRKLTLPFRLSGWSNHDVKVASVFAEKSRIEALRFFQEQKSSIKEMMSKDLLNEAETRELHSNLVKCELGFLASDLIKRAATSIPAERGPGMEPVILCSVAGEELPKLRTNDEFDGSNATWWDLLYNIEPLRKRTLVLFDADDLRSPKSGTRSIRTMTSWEQILEDTLLAFNRNKQLTRFMNFGFCVVRYGVSAALVLIRNREGSNTAVFAFDPHRDDSDWINSEEDGCVLGLPAKFLTSVAKHVYTICEERCTHPQLADLGSAVFSGVNEAITKVQELSRMGYGKSATFAKSSKDFTGVPSVLWDESELLESIRKIENVNAKAFIANRVNRVEISMSPTVGWSFLGQAAKFEPLGLAEAVVLDGLRRTLNPYLPNHRELTLDFAKAISETLTTLLAGKTGKDLQIEARKYCQEFMLGELISPPLETLYRELEHAQMTWVKSDLKRKSCATELEAVFMRFATTDSEKLSKAFNDLADLLKTILPDPRETPEDRQRLARVPIPRFGMSPLVDDPRDTRLAVLDRTEVEGLFAIQKRVYHYLKRKKTERPLSIAVFGPPGSGKSFAVKTVLTSQPDIKMNLKTVNLSQLSGPESLESVFKMASSLSRKDREDRVIEMPCIFFDEFDSRLGSDDLGWLKYFLGPMEDGQFGDTMLKSAVFVFAGGTTSTFSEFARLNRQLVSEEDLLFVRSKGPDFVSRLDAFLDIGGLTQRDAKDDTYQFRRAIILRSMLERRQELSPIDVAKIDRDILRAILRAPTFRHGGRSLRMLLEACSDADGRISSGAIPPFAQLDMIVDAKAFMAEIIDYEDESSQ